MAKVNQTKSVELPPAKEPTPDSGKVQVVQGNIPVLTVQLLAQINANIIELGKKLDAVIEAAKNG